MKGFVGLIFIDVFNKVTLSQKRLKNLGLNTNFKYIQFEIDLKPILLLTNNSS
jgi:hypothetical protein